MRTNPRQRALLTRCDAFEGAVDQIRQWRVPLHGCDAWLDGGYGSRPPIPFAVLESFRQGHTETMCASWASSS